MLQAWMSEEIGPREVGGRYFDGYWRQEYEVIAIERCERSWEITVRWSDGHVTTHATAWDMRRDRVVAMPAKSA